jgi:PAS domain S-box-containing protein
LKTRYGILQEDHSPQIPQIDEQAFLERHHTIVTKKLEDKMRELQQYAETLMKKNRELIASENRSRRLFEDAGIAIFVIDQKTKSIIDVNKQAVTLLEQSKEEILRLPSLSFASMDASIADLYGTQASRMGEAVLQTPKGNMIYVDITSSSIQGMDDSIQTLLFVRDITEKKRMREQLLQAEKMSTMGHIATGIAHEIRNPLAGILLNLQFLDRHLPQGTTDYESVQAALEGVHRVQQVIEDTLGLARVAPPSFREVSMNPLIDKALLYLKLSMRHKSIAIHKQLATHLPRVIIDPNQIQQVLLNMLQNAVDACPDSGCIDVRTDIALQPEVSVQPCVRITIHDSGSGVPAEVLEHLFEPFHTTKTDGTGLGLMLSKYIIDRHHGQITVKNASLGGAEVCIALPAQSIDSEG